MPVFIILLQLQFKTLARLQKWGDVYEQENNETKSMSPMKSQHL